MGGIPVVGETFPQTIERWGCLRLAISFPIESYRSRVFSSTSFIVPIALAVAIKLSIGDLMAIEVGTFYKSSRSHLDR